MRQERRSRRVVGRDREHDASAAVRPANQAYMFGQHVRPALQVPQARLGIARTLAPWMDRRPFPVGGAAADETARAEAVDEQDDDSTVTARP